VSGWIQKILDYGAQNGIDVDFDSLTLASGVTWTRPLWLRVYVADAGGGNRDCAVEAFYGPDLTTQAWYGRAVGKFPTVDVTLYLDENTRAMDSYPPGFPEGEQDDERATLSINDATAGTPGIYYLEWYDDMLKDFGQRVRSELAGASWTNAPAAPDATLLLTDDDLTRNDVRGYLETALVVVADLRYGEAEPTHRGGFGRHGRKMTATVHIFVKNVSGISSSEEAAIKTCTNYLEDVIQELFPAGEPNRLDGYIFDGRIEPGEKPSAVQIEGVDLIHASLNYVGYKQQVA